MFAAALRLARNDLRLFFRDRTGVLLGFALPIALVTIFGFIMGAMGKRGAGGISAVEVAVLDEDVSPASAAFVQALKEGTTIRPELPEDGKPAPTRDELRRRVDEGDDNFALVIPKGFGDGAELVLLRDPGRELESRLVQVGLVSALFKVRGTDMALQMTRRSLHAAGIPAEWDARIQTLLLPFMAGMQSLFVDAKREAKPDAPPVAVADGDPMQFIDHALPVTTEDIIPAGRDKLVGYYVSQSVSGMTVMMLLFTLTGAARSMISERDRGTLRRLLAAPMDPRSILLGKFLSGWALGMLLIVVLFAYASLIFHVDVLSRWGTLLLVSGATAAACTAFGVTIAAWAETDKQADGVSTLLILSMSAIGGAWIPTIAMPAAAQAAAHFTLTYWSLRGYQASLWYGQTWREATVLLPVGIVLAVAAALAVVAVLLFRRRYLAG